MQRAWERGTIIKIGKAAVRERQGTANWEEKERKGKKIIGGEGRSGKDGESNGEEQCAQRGRLPLMKRSIGLCLQDGDKLR